MTCSLSFIDQHCLDLKRSINQRVVENQIQRSYADNILNQLSNLESSDNEINFDWLCNIFSKNQNKISTRLKLKGFQFQKLRIILQQ